MEINAYLDEISTFLKEKMSPIFLEYGIKLASFFINDISVPENDPAVAQLKSALAKRAEMDIIGYSYQQERSFNTLETAASNAGGVMGVGMDIGMGVAMGGVISNQFANVAKTVASGETKQCPGCKNEIGAAERFCHLCGCDTTTNRSEAKHHIKCSKCGAEILEHTKFCPECGNKYNPCIKCKADIPQGAKVCPSCGERLPQICPGCGNSVTGEKFCPECGMPLTKKCPGCGNEVDGSTKFCADCGAKII